MATEKKQPNLSNILSVVIAASALLYSIYNTNNGKQEEKTERLIKLEQQCEFIMVRINAIEGVTKEIRQENKDNNEKINSIYNALLTR